MKNLLLGLIFGLYLSIGVIAQTTQTQNLDDVQSWNDVQFTIPVNKQIDFILTGILRFGENVQRLVDSRAAVALNFKVHDSISLQPSYTYIVITPQNARRRTENRLNFAATYKFPFNKFILSDRNLFERRLRSPQNSSRYRNRLQFELPLKKFYDTKFFTSDEVFYDFSLKKWSRNRFTIGLGKSFNKHFGLDVYYVRQNDGTTRPGDLHIIGTTLKVRT
jgi:hypothetical protein